MMLGWAPRHAKPGGASPAKGLLGGPWTVSSILLTAFLVIAVAVQSVVIAHYRGELQLLASRPAAVSPAATAAAAAAAAALAAAETAVATAELSARSAIQAAATATLMATDAVAAAGLKGAAALPLSSGAAAASSSASSSLGITLPRVAGKPATFAANTNARYRQRVLDQETGPGGVPLPSSRFAPMRATVCLDHMPRHWAPCIMASATPALDYEYAEEVVYPPVKVRVPGFVNDEDRDRWLKVIGTRGLAPLEGRTYLPVHTQGQNYVLRNVRYTMNPYPDNWAPGGTHVMGHNSEIHQFGPTKPEPADRQHDELFIVNTPQAFSYQHFSDHVFKVVMQGRHMLTNDTDIIASSTSVPSNKEVWTWFPVNQSRIIYGKGPSHFTKRLMYSCRTPFWGPYSLQRWAEEVLGPGASTVPMDDRKVVLYYSRSLGAGTAARNSASRRVLNEKDLLPAINKTLAARGLGETLVILDISKFANYKAWVTYANKNVRAFIGPHGGGMLNMQWMSRDTLVVEFQHHAHINYAMWEFGPFLEQNYWNLQYPPEGQDVTVNVADVVKLLEAQLGKVRPDGYYLSHDYAWLRALEGQ